MIEKKLSLSSATIGVLTALPEEFTATCHVLGCTQDISVEGRIYRIGTVRQRDNQLEHVVVVAQLSDMGNNTAAAIAVRLTHDCPNVSEFIMCGIAGGIPNPAKPSDHVRLGDIVITGVKGVVQYDFVKESAKVTEIRDKWHRPSQRLLQVALLLQADEQLDHRPWDRYAKQAIEDLARTQLGARWERPPPESDRLREFVASRPLDYATRLLQSVRIPAKFASIEHPQDPNRITGVPRVFLGVIASANNLQKNPARRDLLAHRFGAKAIEMEGSGVAEAAYQLEKDFFIVRGTCDYCNSDKNDDWHYYAAIIAAAYTRALLETLGPLPLLGYREDGQVLRLAQASSLQGIVAGATHNLASHLPPDTVVNSIQRDLERALAGVVEDQASRMIGDIRAALDAWEFRKAYKLGDEFSTWLDENNSRLSRELVRKAYELLVTIEVTKATNARQDGVPADVSRAEYYLARAKNVIR